MNFFKSVTLVGIGLVFGAVVFNTNPVQSQSRYDELRIYAQVFNLVEEHYVEEKNVSELVTASIRGLLGKLDPYSGYLTKKTYKKFKSESQGGFNGLGFELSLIKRKLKVISVVEDSPAWNAGIKPGDQILSINGKLIYALDFTEATEPLSGKVGKKIKLEIRRKSVELPMVFKLKRARMKLKAAKKILNQDGVLAVRITSFSKNASLELKKIIQAESFDKLLIDLRNNPGGLIDEAIAIVDMFVESGVIVKTRSRQKKEEVNLAQETTTLFPNKKLFILVDGASASASEIVASSLKDLKRAKVLGLKTYGKGSVQSVIPLPADKGGVKLTVARYFTASDKMIDKKGVEPNIKWKPKKDQLSAPMKNVKEDVLLNWALSKIT